ncbi:TPA: hypothetical protein HA324_00545 [Candidatus Thalassarchaeaceae archaeon]|nr:hypothetical protein [Euryarchaeota archaeon]MDC0501509.1 hypothetical protein [Euryarchaeota archaeon]DAC68006.1 MAG TPA: hypothetical protein D7I14_00530 [Candidatus Poseidoniales archaeon]HII41644.1 hypothetical protein [Candidatus Thalassarchaeaceae archaeon]|tara:strand:+ start:2754 stop:4169 length:1416 start_codon:yes stop_codon:yes gene_type:complete
MDWPIGPYGTSMGALLLLTLPIHFLLTRDEKDRRVSLRELPREIREKGYWWHISLYVLMFLYKAVIDYHNEPMKDKVGGFTHWIYSIEGDWTNNIQEYFLNDTLTNLLSGHYLFMYLFMIWFSPIYYILCRDEIMADKAALNYFIIYVLSVPLYLFFNVEVTSTYIADMDALLYHDSFTLFFFIDNDPMDNAIPSLHVGLPISLLIINRLHCRKLGINFNDWRHKEFDRFVSINVIIYLFSIQYLGIHWFIDIIPGIFLAIITSSFVHSVQPIIRARNENGYSSLLPNRNQLVASLITVIICSTWLLAGVVDGPGTDENEANMRVGIGDVNLDTIEVHSLWDPVFVDVSNVGENNLDILLIQRKYVQPHVEKGIFNWDSFEDSGQFIFLPSNESIELEVNPTTLFDVYIILVRISESIDLDSDALGEVRISSHYVDDKLLWTGLLVSLPAFIITGIVLEGAINLRRNQSKL